MRLYYCAFILKPCIFALKNQDVFPKQNTVMIHNLPSLTLTAGASMYVNMCSTVPMSDNVLSATLGEKISSPNRVMVTPDSYGSVLKGFPDLVGSVYYLLIKIILYLYSTLFIPYIHSKVQLVCMYIDKLKQTKHTK